MIKCMLCASTSSYTILFDGRTYLCSSKIDGIRSLSISGVAYSRTGKVMRNKHLQQMFKQLPKDIVFDGELLSCDVAPNKTFSDYTKDIMSIDKNLTIKYHIFDIVNENQTAEERYDSLLKLSLPDFCVIVPQVKIVDFYSMESLEKDAINNGYEGLVLRGCTSLYKYGRGTLKEKCAIKIKRFNDAECIVEGFEEKLHNINELEEDELGFAKRSSCLEGMVPSGTLGSLQVKMLDSDIRFSIGSGMNDATRQEIWNNKKEYLGKIVKFKFFPIGVLKAPRFPIFLNFRDIDDVL